MLGDLSKRGTGAGFHLMGKDRAAPLKAQEEGKFPSPSHPELRRQLMDGEGWGGVGWGGKLTLQQWMARSRKGSGQSFPTSVRKAGTSRPKFCGDRGGTAKLAFLVGLCPL